MEHTKGEWRIQEQFKKPLRTTDENGNEWYHLSCWIFGENKIVASVPYQTKAPGYNYVDILSEMRANAKLIASAPELLEALIVAEEIIYDLNDRMEILVPDQLETIQSAIKKATQ